MSQGGGDTPLTAVVQSHHATVGEWQLYFTLTLLASYLARYRAVYLVGEPVFARHGLQLQHLIYITVYLVGTIGHVLIVARHGLIGHDGLGRVSKHLCHIQVERLHAIGLYEREVCVTSGLTHHIQRCALTLGDGLDVIQMSLVDEQSHALLALVGNDFLGAERLITDR